MQTYEEKLKEVYEEFTNKNVGSLPCELTWETGRCMLAQQVDWSEEDEMKNHVFHKDSFYITATGQGVVGEIHDFEDFKEFCEKWDLFKE